MAEEFNVLEHDLVPEHHLLPEKEAEKVLKELRLTKDQLPKIKLADPCIRALDVLAGPVEEGMVIKVVRRSATSGVSACYRLVIRG
jgi:DNA-directed RNA polymerase subunit H